MLMNMTNCCSMVIKIIELKCKCALSNAIRLSVKLQYFGIWIVWGTEVGRVGVRVTLKCYWIQLKDGKYYAESNKNRWGFLEIKTVSST